METELRLLRGPGGDTVRDMDEVDRGIMHGTAKWRRDDYISICTADEMLRVGAINANRWKKLRSKDERFCIVVYSVRLGEFLLNTIFKYNDN